MNFSCEMTVCFFDTGIKLDKKYFYEFCYATRLRAMFKDYVAMGTVNMSDVDDLVALNSYPSITPRTKLVELTGRSLKRLASTGDVPSGGGISFATVLGFKKRKCSHCGKHVAPNNRTHALSKACVAYSDKHKEGSLHVNNLTSTLKDSRAIVLCDERDEHDLDISDYA